MGWSYNIKASKPITETVVDKIISEFPDELNAKVYGFMKVKQDWGWTCAVDVSLNTDGSLNISGAYFSRDKAIPFGKHMIKALKKTGQFKDIRIYNMSE